MGSVVTGSKATQSSSLSATLSKNGSYVTYDFGKMVSGYGVSPTETPLDKGKSTQTVRMQLFEASGNNSIEGVSTINACYGGTAALSNAIAWVESSAWDGRYAIVVTSDIAGYAKGPARPTGGCGGISMLVGPNAPLVIDSRTRSTFSSHIWDFYKPDPHVEFPTVDGRLSQSCYFAALDSCYTAFCEKNERVHKTEGERATLTDFDYAVFHAPYNKPVQRTLPRLFFLDYGREGPPADAQSKLNKWVNSPLDQTYADRELDLASREPVASTTRKQRSLATPRPSRSATATLRPSTSTWRRS